VASLKCFPDLVEVLLDHGADLSRKNREGKSPMDIARENKCVAFSVAVEDWRRRRGSITQVYQ
jgi:ankyrin repeat protein